MTQRKPTQSKRLYRVQVPLDKSRTFVRILKNLQQVGSARWETTKKPRSTKLTADRLKIGGVRIVTDKRVPTRSAHDILSFEVSPEDMKALENTGWVERAKEPVEAEDEQDEQVGVFKADAQTDADIDPDERVASEPTGPFPWETQSPWRTPALLVGGMALGVIGTLSVVSVVSEGVTYTHIAGLIAFVALVVGFERLVRLAELFWQGHLAEKDAAATAAEIEQMDTGRS